MKPEAFHNQALEDKQYRPVAVKHNPVPVCLQEFEQQQQQQGLELALGLGLGLVPGKLQLVMLHMWEQFHLGWSWHTVQNRSCSDYNRAAQLKVWTRLG